MMNYGLMIFLVMLFMNPAWALEVEGVHVADSVTVGSQTLQLNGAGVRTKFFFDIYVGALYLPAKVSEAKQAIEGKGPKRVSMHFLYDEVSAKKLADGWADGFEKNQPKEAMAKLSARLDQFNAMFVDAHKGDVFVFDFLEDGSTSVILKGNQAGSIAGTDFQQALLAVWLGKKPADKGLKKAMLQGAC